MREIEIKLRVHDTPKTLQALAKAGVTLSQPTKQHDVVYARPDAKDGDPAEAWLRVRVENDTKVIFTLKRSVAGEMDSIEHETEVADGSAITYIITELGYELFSDLTKIRRKGHHGDMEICFDELPELGTFLELELLEADNADHDTVEAKLWEFATQLGFFKADLVTSGYDVLMRQRQAAGK